MQLGIVEILICVVAIAVVLRVTRKRPTLGMLLTLFVFIFPALIVAYLSTSSAPAPITIVSTSDRGRHVNETHVICTDCDDDYEGISSMVVSFTSDTDCEDCEDDECDECDETSSDCGDGDTKDEAKSAGKHGIVLAEVTEDADFDDGNLLRSAAEELSTDKPEWIYNERVTPIASPQEGLARLVVQSGPFDTREECDSQLIWSMKEAVGDYASEYASALGYEGSRWFRLEIPGDELYEAISREHDGFHEFDIAGTDPMPVKYVELTLDRGFHERVIERPHQQAMQLTRVAQSGIGSLGVLAIIGTALGLLKLEGLPNSSRRKLRIGATIGGIGLLLGFLLLASKV